MLTEIHLKSLHGQETNRTEKPNVLGQIQTLPTVKLKAQFEKRVRV